MEISALELTLVSSRCELMPLAHLNCSQERHLIRKVALQSLTTYVYIGNTSLIRGNYTQNKLW